MTPSAHDFADAILTTTDRETASGEPWCGARDAKEVKLWLTDRSKPLGGALRQMVRLARLMARADGRHYTSFLYARVPALWTRFFRREFEEAFARGKLSGIAETTAKGAVLTEVSMSSEGQPFDLHYAQMPRLGALLDVLHNALGFKTVDEILEPVTGATPQGAADEVARRLSAVLNAWLTPRLGSTHQTRQAKAIRSFLLTTGSLSAEAVDDDAIFELWRQFSTDPELEGFRLYRSAARLAIRYKQALAIAAVEAALAQAGGSRPYQTDPVELDSLTSSPLNPDEWTSPEDLAQRSLIEITEWVSPFDVLFVPPADRVKWLTKADRLFLADVFGAPEAQQETPAEVSSALFGPGKFDKRLVRTLLRCHYFGDLQNSIVERLRRGRAFQANLDGGTYKGVLQRYLELSDQAQLLLGATAFVLVGARKMEGLSLAQAFLGPEFKALVADVVSTAQPTTPRPKAVPTDLMVLLLSQMENPQRPEARKIQTAFRQINRVGFRKQDGDLAEMMEALIVGSEVLEDLQSGLFKITKAISAQPIERIFSEDASTFLQHFEVLHGVREETPGLYEAPHC